MKSIKKPVMLVTAGAIALAGIGGGTFALWSDTATVNAGTVTSGNLDIKELQKRTSSRNYNGWTTEIDLDTYRAVPGDHIQVGASFDLAIKGDNMRAVAVTEKLELGPEASELAKYVTVTYEAMEVNPYATYLDGPIRQTGGLPYEGEDLPYMKFDGFENEPGFTILKPNEFDGKWDLSAYKTISFSRATPERLLTKENIADLTNFNVRLVQKPSADTATP